MNTSVNKLVCFGEILWDVLPAGDLPGGAPMNVAYHLHKLKRNVSLITRIGADSRGRELINILSQQGIATDYVSIDHHHPTGIVYAKPKGPHEMQYDIVYPSAWDFIPWENSFATLMQQADYLVFGSLVCRNEVSAKTLFQLLEADVTKVLDINLRPPHFNRTLVEQLLHKTDVLKLNLSELELITGWFAPVQAVTDRIQLIRDRFRIETIVVTLGENGAILHMNEKYYQHPGYHVQVSDTVGSGDAFLAAFLSKLIDRAPPDDILDYACALGALVASYPGAWPNYHIHEIDELTGGNTVEKIKNF